VMKDILFPFKIIEYGEENSRKSPLDIKIASDLDVKVPFQEFNRRKRWIGVLKNDNNNRNTKRK